MNYEHIRSEREGPVTVVTLVNAARMNPLSTAMQSELLAEFRSLRSDESVRAVVLIGEGRGFCVGADLSSMGPVEGDARSVGERTAEWMKNLSNPLILAIRSMPVPVVSAVNGACAGAGVGLALAADVVLMARKAYLYLPFIPKLGIVPDLGATWFLERLLGRSRAMALTLLGDRLPADKAVSWGLAWDCVEEEALLGEALALAQRLAVLPSHAAIQTRQALDAAAVNSLEQQLQYEADCQRRLLDLPSFAEGVQAFIDKREPNFQR
jgi:2-(1,2-epoxy-1,2-dihydrophenyl)acetyl-CoA isomerase